ncbi:hypothetical protein V493_01850 [Pseudogymnoascus sp. VKM F-4281 (FW-2241)]|nr:hypothetical protein V493_01850 [Pseudogymnoascus sp. VKM F-4281 (FW-2241)]
MHFTNALITSLALVGSSTAYFSIPLGNAPAAAAPAPAAPAAAQPVSISWCPFGSWLFQPSRYRVVWPFPLILATNNGPAPVGLPAPAVACPASCVPPPVTVAAPPVTLPGPLPTDVTAASAICAGGNPPKPTPLFDENGAWSCCVGPILGAGVGCA